MFNNNGILHDYEAIGGCRCNFSATEHQIIW